MAPSQHFACAALAVLLIAGAASASKPQGRRLLNPIYEEETKVNGPGTPTFKYKAAPAPAEYVSENKVRSEKPYVIVNHKEPGQTLQVEGQTKVDTVEGAKFAYKSGKGGNEYRFDSGKRAFEVNVNRKATVNLPATDVTVSGGEPLAVRSYNAFTGPIPNNTATFATGDGPKYDNSWSVNVGPGSGRRLLAAVRRLLNPIYEEETKVNGPGTPTFKYKAAPAPAEYVSENKVRSEKPYVIVNHKEPGQTLQVEGQTKVDTVEGAKFAYKSGKGGNEYRFDSGKRAFEVNVNRKATVNLPATDVTVSGGEPLAVRSYNAFTGPIPNNTATFATGDGPKYDNSWSVNVGPGSGRRLLAAVRRLLNPIYEEETKVNGPGTPTFKYKAAPAPAEYVSETKVRSEKPYVIVNHKEPGQTLQVEGQTKVDTVEGAKFAYKSGKGGNEYRFDSGKRAFEVNVNRKATVNLPATDVTVSGGEPLAVRSYNAFTGPIPNNTATFATGDGPKYDNSWSVNVGPGSGRRLLAAVRRLLNPIYEEETKVNGPGTPTFKYKVAPAPAEYVSENKVRSEKPYVIVNHKEPGQTLQVEGQTKVDTVEGAKFAYKSGKGGNEYRFDSGKRAFEVNVNRKATVNLPATDVTVSGGEPLAVRSYNAFTGPIPNNTATFATGDGPKYDNSWSVNVGPGSGRRLLAAVRRLLNPIYEEETKVNGPGTPTYKQRAAPAPAEYVSETQVRSEKPYVSVSRQEPGAAIQAEGSTTVQTTEGASLSANSA